ncbi:MULTISPECIES: DUF742 domain-containing protein [Streptomyces]|uniref:DUF742 domain-containing protein n=1 Tax=Streptomyces ochraceiscleroticus TaxID=47761 RepID=A0ABW1MNX3_9ACTN|nr:MULTISPECIES: DUF742 domain-containing protein [Streptomyces]
MSPLGPDDDPDRLYTVTGGRSRAAGSRFDLVTLIVAECEPAPGMQSEHVRILELARRPTAVVELSAALRLPVSVVRILLTDLLDTGRITARHPRTAARAELPEPDLLKEVLDALQRL